MKLSDYQAIHTQRSTFVVKPDHQVEPIESVIKAGETYNVVMKQNTTPDPAKGSKLNSTSIDNSANQLAIMRGLIVKERLFV